MSAYAGTQGYLPYQQPPKAPSGYTQYPQPPKAPKLLGSTTTNNHAFLKKEHDNNNKKALDNIRSVLGDLKMPPPNLRGSIKHPANQNGDITIEVSDDDKTYKVTVKKTDNNGRKLSEPVECPSWVKEFLGNPDFCVRDANGNWQPYVTTLTTSNPDGSTTEITTTMTDTETTITERTTSSTGTITETTTTTTPTSTSTTMTFTTTISTSSTSTSSTSPSSTSPSSTSTSSTTITTSVTQTINANRSIMDAKCIIEGFNYEITEITKDTYTLQLTQDDNRRLKEMFENHSSNISTTKEMSRDKSIDALTETAANFGLYGQNRRPTPNRKLSDSASHYPYQNNGFKQEQSLINVIGEAGVECLKAKIQEMQNGTNLKPEVDDQEGSMATGTKIGIGVAGSIAILLTILICRRLKKCLHAPEPADAAPATDPAPPEPPAEPAASAPTGGPTAAAAKPAAAAEPAAGAPDADTATARDGAPHAPEAAPEAAPPAAPRAGDAPRAAAEDSASASDEDSAGAADTLASGAPAKLASEATPGATDAPEAEGQAEINSSQISMKEIKKELIDPDETLSQDESVPPERIDSISKTFTKELIKIIETINFEEDISSKEVCLNTINKLDYGGITLPKAIEDILKELSKETRQIKIGSETFELNFKTKETSFSERMKTLQRVYHLLMKDEKFIELLTDEKLNEMVSTFIDHLKEKNQDDFSKKLLEVIKVIATKDTIDEILTQLTPFLIKKGMKESTEEDKLEAGLEMLNKFWSKYTSSTINKENAKDQFLTKCYDCIKEEVENKKKVQNLIDLAKECLNPEDVIEKKILTAIVNLSEDNHRNEAIELLDALMHTPQYEVMPSFFLNSNQDLYKDKYYKLRDTIKRLNDKGLLEINCGHIMPLLQLKILVNNKKNNLSHQDIESIRKNLENIRLQVDYFQSVKYVLIEILNQDKTLNDKNDETQDILKLINILLIMSDYDETKEELSDYEQRFKIKTEEFKPKSKIGKNIKNDIEALSSQQKNNNCIIT